MTRHALAMLILGILGLVALPAAWRAWNWVPPVPGRSVENAPAPLVVEPPPPDSIWTRLVRAAPFRESRVPARHRFDARRTVVTAPAVPRPLLVLAGIAWGQDPAAVVEGLPGVEGGMVVRRGDQVGGLVVTAVGRDHVKVRGMDSTWTLRVREVR